MVNGKEVDIGMFSVRELGGGRGRGGDDVLFGNEISKWFFFSKNL